MLAGRQLVHGRTEFLPETFWTEVIQSVVGSLAGCHDQK